MICSASFTTSASIVAEKSSVWRAAGSVETMRRTSGQKPMSIMRSASSSTSTSTLREVDHAGAHVIHQPARRRDDDVDAGAQGALLAVAIHAAVDGHAGEGRVVREAVMSSSICTASSRVGASTRPRMCPPVDGVFSRRCRIGSRNAAVLPVPVSAQAMRSVACEDDGKDRALDGRGLDEAAVGDAFEEARVQVEGGELEGRRVVRHHLERHHRAW